MNPIKASQIFLSSTCICRPKGILTIPAHMDSVAYCRFIYGALWGEREQAACILATEERMRYQNVREMTQ